ncbi:MAG: radical SAM family heme chaperone HemW [Desulfobacterales bacterium]
MPPGLYIHVPFCIRKCPYCDFYSTEDLSFQQAYADALVREMSLRASFIPDAAFDTVYLGGGTPSTLDPSTLGRILEAAHRHFSIDPAAEITMEANPGTVAPKTLSACRSVGVNRINIGVQSFNDKNLAFLGRIHSAQQAKDSIYAARRAGFENIGLDLIYGLPGQDAASWQKDLSCAAAFAPSHISCYMLTMEEGTKMAKDRDAKKFTPLCEELVSSMFLQASEYLCSAGYQHYEISNFALSDKTRSAHNQKYWKNASYVGLGPSAHSYIEPERSWNHRSLHRYIRAVCQNRLPTEDSEHLAGSQLMIEALYLGLRQSDGIDIKKFENRFKKNFHQMLAPQLDHLASSGLLSLTTRTCRPTLQGMLYMDSIVSRLVAQTPG